MGIKKLLAGLGASLLLTMSVPAMVLAATTTVVTPTNAQGWAFFQEVPNGSGSFVTGPETPPMGVGSAQLTVDSTGRELLLNNDFAGTKLSDITKLAYSTYRQLGSDPLAISLQLDIDTNATDTNTSWQGRLVYEPYFNHTVIAGEWQSWNTLDDAADGNWWFSGAPGNTLCPQSNPCTWTELTTAFPSASIRINNTTDTAGFINFKAGGPWAPGFVGNVDAFTIGINNGDQTFNFEPYQTATSKEQCKKDGYKTLTDASGRSFKNQGDCVSYVATAEKNAASGLTQF